MGNATIRPLLDTEYLYRIKMGSMLSDNQPINTPVHVNKKAIGFNWLFSFVYSEMVKPKNELIIRQFNDTQ